ncbi:MAG: hypothetical protein ACLVJ6_11515 [Merdibacter sp.]
MRAMDAQRIQRPTLARIAIQHKKDREQLRKRCASSMWRPPAPRMR